MQTWRPQSVLWLLFIVAACSLLFVCNILEIRTYTIKTAYFLQSSPRVQEELSMKGFFIRTPGCTIPEMRAMDDSIKKYIFMEKSVLCNNGTPPLIDSNRTSIYLLESSLEYYNLNDTEQLTCCYQEFHRVAPGQSKDDRVDFGKECVPFEVWTDIEHEFIRVKCFHNRSMIYKDFFSFVPARNASNVGKEKLNVLIVGIDAVSRLNLHRQMPETVRFMKELKSYEMMGYNKVGDNTFPNLIPALTGMSEDELQRTCWNASTHFDECPFVWKDFKDSGRLTGFGEDSAWMGLFYYTKKGFRRQPTDYFWDHFDMTAEKEIGNMHRLNVDQCVGARLVHKVFLDYISKFAETMRVNRLPYFGFFWGASLTHDFLNKPKLGDRDYVDFLKMLNASGTLDDTVLVLMSDHGIRWGEIRSTYQGRMEERLPFLYLRFPESFAKRNPLAINNLRTNVRRLTTPYDLHETLLDLVDPKKLRDDSIQERNVSNQTTRRAYSLFDKITTNRSCESAGISAHWCTCQTSEKVDVGDQVVQEAANHTVNEINELLVGYADCVYLELEEVLDATVQINTDVIMQGTQNQDYTITFRTRPSAAVFEATVRRIFLPTNEYHFNVTGTVSRINLYGKQSLCITDFHLKLYCYCKQYISNNNNNINPIID
ncbi:PREDICTED: uncharacterized protein LOC108569125 isoform X2 [Nicrophorus vespilloides]|nr:PREDICTED: uncharacterized protein LOC108569125 isoform X2 [Nicrophorus vespilloides]XP_017786041.1 PREDICTED: uncharacterized protein LOC108569125 isoform X2 [Nicrophorus vespilloides]XP_017786042.1 PREDICTED: uncharacterized protein LOC108569125 isoform X2 [Nicrophorus vespilloides]